MFPRAFLTTTLLRLASALWTEPTQVLQPITCEQCMQTSIMNPLPIGIQGRLDVVYGVRIDRRKGHQIASQTPFLCIANCDRFYICYIKLIVESTSAYGPIAGYYQMLNLQWLDVGGNSGVQVYCGRPGDEVLLR